MILGRRARAWRLPVIGSCGGSAIAAIGVCGAGSWTLLGSTATGSTGSGSAQTALYSHPLGSGLSALTTALIAYVNFVRGTTFL